MTTSYLNDEFTLPFESDYLPMDMNSLSTNNWQDDDIDSFLTYPGNTTETALDSGLFSVPRDDKFDVSTTSMSHLDSAPSVPVTPSSEFTTSNHSKNVLSTPFGNANGQFLFSESSANNFHNFIDDSSSRSSTVSLFDDSNAYGLESAFRNVSRTDTNETQASAFSASFYSNDNSPVASSAPNGSLRSLDPSIMGTLSLGDIDSADMSPSQPLLVSASTVAAVSAVGAAKPASLVKAAGNTSPVQRKLSTPMGSISPSLASADDKKPLRKQSESRLSLPELYNRMGLGHNHEEAQRREQRILELLKSFGFKLGEKTWIRDTTDKTRKEIIDKIYDETISEYGYPKELVETIVRRGTYYQQQGRLRRERRSKKN